MDIDKLPTPDVKYLRKCVNELRYYGQFSEGQDGYAAVCYLEKYVRDIEEREDKLAEVCEMVDSYMFRRCAIKDTNASNVLERIAMMLKEKELRIRYQDLVCSICNLADKHSPGKTVTTDGLYDALSRILSK